MSSEIAPRASATGALARLAPDQLEVIRNTVAKGASDHELAMFLELASRYSLDPFAREIWAVKLGGTSGPVTIMVGRDGFLAIANRHPAFDGIESDVVRMSDTFKRTSAGIEHTYGTQRGEILGGYCLAHRKDRSRPAYFFAAFSEYSRSSNPAWKNYPSAMIVKVAEVNALKRAFSISGLVSEDEMMAVSEPVGRSSPYQPAGSDDALREDWRTRWATLKAQWSTAGGDVNGLRTMLKAEGIHGAKALEDDSKWTRAQGAVALSLGNAEDDEAVADRIWSETKDAQLHDQ